MVIRKDLKPFRQSVPNAAALAMAGDIAARLGLPFDAQAVAEQSRSLYENMFADLKQVLEIEAPPRLESGSYSLTRLFLTPDAARAPVIVLDIYFDYWIAALSQIAAIATFTVPDKPLWLALGARMSETFELFVEPSRFETARQNMAPLFADHGELMNISFGMARAMTIFALCHELAHWQCGHLDQAPGAEQELEADREAASLFLRLVQRGEKAAETSVFIDPKVAGAPLLLARLFVGFEAWAGMDSARVNHPAAQERLRMLDGILRPELTPVALEIADGMAKGITDLESLLDDPAGF